ncbi:YkvA family protein [Paenibacillus lautus]|uniref:YkvA family protein n=1 Tax=Paenibacillus lautus TaxID=1401 RepID=UPI002DBD37CC|nr:YkvA family protein [Paenibacillus lautus]MEC0311513.1 YkvA family protein [Paenibacillus lautus]
MMGRIKRWAGMLKRKVFLLYYAYKDNRTPWYAKIFAICVVAYAFSPIDLIPDFIPILGYLDDVILVPLGIAITLKMIPNAVVQEHELQAEERMKRGKPKNWFAASIIIAIWLAALLWVSLFAYRYVLNE